MSTLCQPGVETCYNASVPATNRLSLHKLGAAHNVAFGCFAALGHPQAEFYPAHAVARRHYAYLNRRASRSRRGGSLKDSFKPFVQHNDPPTK